MRALLFLSFLSIHEKMTLIVSLSFAALSLWIAESKVLSALDTVEEERLGLRLRCLFTCSQSGALRLKYKNDVIQVIASFAPLSR